MVVRLSHDKGEVTIRGRIVEHVDEFEDDNSLVNIIPQISLGSVLRSSAFPNGIMIEQIREERDESPQQKWARGRDNIGQD